MFNHIYTPDEEFVELVLSVKKWKQRNKKKAIMQASENKMYREKKYSQCTIWLIWVPHLDGFNEGNPGCWSVTKIQWNC